MIDKLDAIGGQTLKEIESATSLDTLDQVRISILGKKGALSEVLKGLGSVEPKQRPVVGGAANEWKRRSACESSSGIPQRRAKGEAKECYERKAHGLLSGSQL